MKYVIALWGALGLAESVAVAEHWPLDEAPSPQWRVVGGVRAATGVVGRSLVFDGGSLVALSDSAQLNGGAAGFTVSVWFNPYALDAGQQMLVGKNRYALDERQWGLTIEADGSLRAYLRQAAWNVISCREPLRAGNWYWAVLTVGGDRASLYLNGRLVGETKLAKPLAATKAPITLGGIDDDGRARQLFRGALDELRYEPRVLTAAEIAVAYRPVDAVHEVPKSWRADVPLWDAAQTLGKAGELPRLDGVEFHVIKKWDREADGYTFLHGVGLAWHKGKLYASIGHNKGNENTVTEEAQYRVSDDGGRTWSELRVIDAGEEENLAVSHGVFHSHAGKLWAFHGAYYNKMERIHTRAYSLDESTGRWTPHGVVVEHGFWALNQPMPTADGNWIMAGISAGRYSNQTANPPAVALSRGADFTKWDFVGVPTPPGMRMWGESAVIVDGAAVWNIARYGAKPLALVARSTDHGRTWTAAAESNLPMATSKPCAGMLSTGQRFLVCTTAAENGGRRSPLTIAVGRPGSEVFSRVFVIRDAEMPGISGESSPTASLSYPCAVEHEGKLYVGYSNNGGRRGNLNSAELAIVPISALVVGDAP